jgi:hypothetical protein
VTEDEENLGSLLSSSVYFWSSKLWVGPNFSNVGVDRRQLHVDRWLENVLRDVARLSGARATFEKTGNVTMRRSI